MLKVQLSRETDYVSIRFSGAQSLRKNGMPGDNLDSFTYPIIFDLYCKTLAQR